MIMTRPVLVIHGGAGVLAPGTLTPDREAKVRNTMDQSLISGYKILESGGSAVEAVTESIKIMEDCPELNAGKGAVFTIEKTNELDAGIMEGHTGKAGGVSTLTKVKNPILAAVEVMQNTVHVLLCGSSADNFAANQGLSMVNPSYFYTDLRYNQLHKILVSSGRQPQLDHNVVPDEWSEKQNNTEQGTVGAVALDSQCHLAAGSSTGGMGGKLCGRVSDSSIVGAGFYADKRIAVSGTGNGDGFLENCACKRVADLVELNNMKISEACDKVVFETLGEWSAGLIAVDVDGNISMPFNTGGMFRGYKNKEKCYIDVFK